MFERLLRGVVELEVEAVRGREADEEEVEGRLSNKLLVPRVFREFGWGLDACWGWGWLTSIVQGDQGAASLC